MKTTRKLELTGGHQITIEDHEWPVVARASIWLPDGRFSAIAIREHQQTGVVLVYGTGTTGPARVNGGFILGCKPGNDQIIDQVLALGGLIQAPKYLIDELTGFVEKL